MSMSSSEIFDSVAPAYATHVAKADFLAMAEERTSTSGFGLKRPYAVAYRAAHEMVLTFSASFAGGTGGEIASKKEGDLTVSFFKTTTGGSASSTIQTELGQTTYGKRLIGLMKGNILSVGVTGDSNK